MEDNVEFTLEGMVYRISYNTIIHRNKMIGTYNFVAKLVNAGLLGSID